MGSGLVPVVGVSLPHDPVTRDPLHEPEGPTPGGAPRDALQAGGIDDRHGLQEIGDLRRDFLEGDDDRAGIAGGDVLDVRDRRQHVEPARRIGGLLEVLHDIGGNHVLPAVELHALAQRERDRLPVRCDRPALGEAGEGPKRLIVADERVVEALVNREALEEQVVRVEGDRVLRKTHG
jgi:hypothetical protein